MNEGIDYPVTFAGLLGVAIYKIFLGLVRRANAEDLEMIAYQGAIRKGIVKNYRLTFVSGWVLLILFMFHGGCIASSRAMVPDRLDTAASVHKAVIDEKCEQCEKTELLYESHPPRQSSLRHSLSERMPQLFQRSVRSLMLCTLYYTVLFGLFCLMDILIHRGTIIAQCVGFTCSVVLAAPLHMHWTHALVSPPLPNTLRSMKSIWNTFSWRDIGSLLLASMLYASSQAVFIVGLVIATVAVHLVFQTGEYDIDSLLVGLTIMAIGFVCLHLPATIILTRVEWFLMSRVEAPDVQACGHTLPFSSRTGLDRRDCGIPVLDAFRSIDFSMFRKTLKVYSGFTAALVASTVLFYFCQRTLGAHEVSCLDHDTRIAETLLRWAIVADIRGTADAEYVCFIVY